MVDYVKVEIEVPHGTAAKVEGRRFRPAYPAPERKEGKVTLHLRDDDGDVVELVLIEGTSRAGS